MPPHPRRIRACQYARPSLVTLDPVTFVHYAIVLAKRPADDSTIPGGLAEDMEQWSGDYRRTLRPAARAHAGKGQRAISVPARRGERQGNRDQAKKKPECRYGPAMLEQIMLIMFVLNRRCWRNT